MKGGMSTRMKVAVGVGIGIVCVVVLVLVLVWILYWNPKAEREEAEKLEAERRAREEEERRRFERERMVITFVQFDHGHAMQMRNNFATSTKSILCNESKCIEMSGSEWKEKDGVVTVVKGVGGARFRSERAMENGVLNPMKFTFVDMAMIHLSSDFSFKVPLPSGPGVYDVIVKTGDMNHPQNCTPRVGIQVGTSVTPVVSDEHSEAVDIRRSGEVTSRVDLKAASECVFVGMTPSVPSYKIFRILKKPSGASSETESDRMFTRAEIHATMESVRTVFPGASVLTSSLLSRIAPEATYAARPIGWVANNSGFMNEGKDSEQQEDVFVCRMGPGPEGADACAGNIDASTKHAILALIRAKPALIDAARLPPAFVATVHSFASVDGMPNRLKQIQLVRVQ